MGESSRSASCEDPWNGEIAVVVTVVLIVKLPIRDSKGMKGKTSLGQDKEPGLLGRKGNRRVTVVVKDLRVASQIASPLIFQLCVHSSAYLTP